MIFVRRRWLAAFFNSEFMAGDYIAY